MPTAAQTREVAKANALVSAWRKRYATTPARNAVVLILSVAELETRAGDYRDSHNWGQVQRRQLTADEKTILLNGGTPKPRDANEILSTDTHPTATGPTTYSVWLWAFPDDVAGADKLLSVLLEERPAIKNAIEKLTYEGLAGLMYDSKYFEGSHPRNEVGGPAANIAAYAESMRKQNVDGLLFGWMPPLGAVPDLPSTKATEEPGELAPASPEPAEITAIAVQQNATPEPDPFPAEPVTTPATPAAKAIAFAGPITTATMGIFVLLALIAAVAHACGVVH